MLTYFLNTGEKKGKLSIIESSRSSWLKLMWQGGSLCLLQPVFIMCVWKW